MGLFVIAVETLWNKMPDQKNKKNTGGEQERGKRFIITSFYAISALRRYYVFNTSAY